jgi:hypothetical protein
MELLDKNIEKLKDIWKGEDDRQNAKIVLIAAIAHATDITVKQAEEILAALDEILLTTNEAPKIKRDPAL